MGLLVGALFVAYKALKYPGSIHRSNVMECVALVLAFGLAGGLVGLGFGARARLSDEDK
jgi:hypothetical protein